MNIVDKLVLAKGGFVVYDCEIYTPHPLGRDGQLNGKNLKRLCSAQELKHLIEGNFSDAKKFLQCAVSPLLSRNILDTKAEANYIFDQIYTRHLPLGFGGSNCHFYEKRNSKELVIGDENFGRVTSKPRNLVSAVEKPVNLRDIKFLEEGKHLILSKKLKPYEMIGEDGRYFWDNIWVSMKFKPRGDKLKISEPYIREKCHHPFVYNDGEICFDGTSRWERLGIDFGTKEMNLPLMRQIKQAFYEAQKTMVKGYKEIVNPVHRLNRLNFPDEYRGAP